MRRQLSVLHLYSGNLFGGVERMLISVAAADSPALRHEFALCFDGRLSRALTELGAPVEVLGPVRLRSPVSVWRARRALARVLDRRRFDAVICHSIWSYCVFGGVGAKAGYRRTLFLHDVPEPANAYYRWAAHSPPQLCIANSAYTARLALAWQPTVPTRVIHPLVPPPKPANALDAEALRAQLGAAPGEVVILQASRLDPWKGHRNLLRALALMRDVPGWKCWIAGSPQRPKEAAYQRELALLVASHDLGARVRFIGHRDDMDVTMAACDVYCQPNETPEPFGMVFVEALYGGKPAVGSALGGSLEIVDSSSGLLCPVDPEALSAALRSLVESAELRARFAASGPPRARALCGIERFTEDLSEALGQIPAAL